MITISLTKQDNTVDVYLSGDNEVFAGGSIAFDCDVPPVETLYHVPMRVTRALDSPPGTQTRMLYPPWDRRWADTPEVEWRVRTDDQLMQIPLDDDDVGSLALNYDTSQLWKLLMVPPEWEKAGYLPRIFPQSPTLSPKPLLVMSLRFNGDPGEVSVNFDPPPAYPFQNAVTLLFVWNQHGTYTVRSSVVEAPLLETPDDNLDDMQQAVDTAWQLLGVDDPLAANQARLILAPHRSAGE